jgi:hypothetical protein
MAGEIDGKIDGTAALQAASLRMLPAFTVLSRTLNRLISTLESVDKMQQEALSVGARSSAILSNNSEILRGHPGGMKVALESSISLMQAGFIKHSKGMVQLVNQAKATAQDSQQIIAAFAKLSSAMPLSTKVMDKLSANMIEVSKKYGIQTGALIASLAKHSDTIARFIGLGGGDKDIMDAMTDVTSKAGIMHADTIGLLAEKLTFKEGAADLAKIILHTGDTQLAARIQSGKASEKLLMDMNKAIIKQYDQLVSSGNTNRMIRSEIAKQFGFDVRQIVAMKALQESFDNGMNLQKLGLDELGAVYGESVGTFLKEIAAPIQTMLIPLIGGIMWAVNGVKETVAGWGDWVGAITRGVVRIFAILATIRTIQIAIKFWNQMAAYSSAGWGGLIVAAVVGIGVGIAESAYSAKQTAAEEARERRKNKQGAIDNAKARWSRYITEGIIAASMTSQNAFLAVGQDTLEVQRGIIDVLLHQRRDHQGVAKSKTSAPIGKGK